MATGPSAPSAPKSTDAAARPSLRYLGVLVLVMFLLTSAVGGSLGLEGSYLLVTLASHIGLALVTLGIAAYATSFVGRYYRTLPRASAGIAAIAALGATVAGAAFLVGGQSNGALYAMEGLALIGILAAIVMIVVGGPSGKLAPAGTSH
jgi:hypothetical protein